MICSNESDKFYRHCNEDVSNDLYILKLKIFQLSERIRKRRSTDSILNSIYEFHDQDRDINKIIAAIKCIYTLERVTDHRPSTRFRFYKRSRLQRHVFFFFLNIYEYFFFFAFFSFPSLFYSYTYGCIFN